MSDTKLQESQNVTDKQSFSPSADQMKWLDTAIQLETDTITDIESGCGINRKQWYRWLAIEGFIEWFNGEWEKRLKGHAWKLDAIGMKNSKRDFNYWKAMQQRAGRLQETPQSLQQINIGDKSNSITFVNFKDETKS